MADGIEVPPVGTPPRRTPEGPLSRRPPRKGGAAATAEAPAPAPTSAEDAPGTGRIDVRV